MIIRKNFNSDLENIICKFEEQVTLKKSDIWEQTIVAVDLGINSAATISVLRSDGTILGRHFLKLPKEYDSLKHTLHRIKKHNKMEMLKHQDFGLIVY